MKIIPYISQKEKKELSGPIKVVLKKYKVKGTVSICDHYELVVQIRLCPVNFKGLKNLDGQGYYSFNHAQSEIGWSEKEKQFLKQLYSAMNKGNDDNSDLTTHYHMHIRVGD